MRIGILTLPPHTNYGCILQAYALQTALQQMGHNVCVFNKDHSVRKFTQWEIIKGFMVRILYSIKSLRVFSYYNIQKENLTRSQELAIKTQHTERFVTQHIKQYLYHNLKKDIRQGDFDAIVVGSDQVWRPMYINPSDLPYVYLKFALRWNIKRVGYAISFGTEDWEYSLRQTHLCKGLAKRFDALSFREDTGVVNCKIHFGIEAVKVVDPTLLHSQEHYRNLFNHVEERAEIFSYILDRNTAAEAAICKIANRQSFTVNTFSPPDGSAVLLPVEDWLQSIDRCKFVVTDSFHGCIFSIIFNKPFWVIGNKSRGQARFISLLRTFNLQNRLITVEELPTIDVEQPINWGKVNSILLSERNHALSFLKEALK